MPLEWSASPPSAPSPSPESSALPVSDAPEAMRVSVPVACPAASSPAGTGLAPGTAAGSWSPQVWVAGAEGAGDDVADGSAGLALGTAESGACWSRVDPSCSSP